MIPDPITIIRDYISHPSVSTDQAYAEGMRGARTYVSSLLEKLGFEVEEVATPLHPIVLAERGADHPEWPHVIIYGHYDVQPADPFDLWTGDPFKAEVRNGRIYGRGTADNKGPQAVQLAALARLLEKEPDLPLRITWLIEGEEEMGSPSIPGFLEKYSERLRQADVILMSDTSCLDPENMVITVGLRGLTGVEVVLTGPNSDLHSGIHGGALENPIQALVDLCSSLHNPDGTVNIPGFYDDVVPPEDWERAELAKLPLGPEKYKEFLGIPEFHAPPGFSPFEAIRFGPTLEFNGIGGGYQGEGEKTVIPSRAFAKITCRLVPNQTPEKIQKLLIDTLKERCSKKVKLDIRAFSGGVPYLVVPPGRPNTPANQSPVLALAFAAAEKSITSTWGKPPIYLREGGSVPIIGQLHKATGLDCLMFGLFTPADNLHAPNESFHLGIMEKAISAYEGIFAELAHGGSSRT